MKTLDLGAFSISLSVRDLEKSRTFYEKLGFVASGGGQGYLILRSGTTVIGLFHGMFEGNILTFNPGLSNVEQRPGPLLEALRVEEFADVRAIQNHLQGEGIELTMSVDEAENPTGPGSVMCLDPDGNAILIDQFFDKPTR